MHSVSLVFMTMVRTLILSSIVGLLCQCSNPLHPREECYSKSKCSQAPKNCLVEVAAGYGADLGTLATSHTAEFALCLNMEGLCKADCDNCINRLNANGNIHRYGACTSGTNKYKFKPEVL